MHVLQGSKATSELHVVNNRRNKIKKISFDETLQLYPKDFFWLKNSQGDENRRVRDTERTPVHNSMV